LYLKGNKIHVVIRNQGQGSVSPQMAMQGRLKVQSKNHTAPGRLLQLDPTRAKLNKGKKELHYNTGLSLTASEMVVAELSKVPGKGLKQQKRLTPLGRNPNGIGFGKGPEHAGG
jgi:hypothetical protein